MIRKILCSYKIEESFTIRFLQRVTILLVTIFLCSCKKTDEQIIKNELTKIVVKEIKDSVEILQGTVSLSLLYWAPGRPITVEMRTPQFLCKAEKIERYASNSEIRADSLTSGVFSVYETLDKISYPYLPGVYKRGAPKILIGDIDTLLINSGCSSISTGDWVIIGATGY